MRLKRRVQLDSQFRKLCGAQNVLGVPLQRSQLKVLRLIGIAQRTGLAAYRRWG
jgi:hypothetical protein